MVNGCEMLLCEVTRGLHVIGKGNSTPRRGVTSGPNK